MYSYTRLHVTHQFGNIPMENALKNEKAKICVWEHFKCKKNWQKESVWEHIGM